MVAGYYAMLMFMSSDLFVSSGNNSGGTFLWFVTSAPTKGWSVPDYPLVIIPVGISFFSIYAHTIISFYIWVTPFKFWFFFLFFRK